MFIGIVEILFGIPNSHDSGGVLLFHVFIFRDRDDLAKLIENLEKGDIPKIEKSDLSGKNMKAFCLHICDTCMAPYMHNLPIQSNRLKWLHLYTD